MSHGFIVVTVSHTYESAEVQFPQRRVELGKGLDGPNKPATPNIGVSTRVADIHFVIDYLIEVVRGDTDALEKRSLPHGLAAAIDVSKIGIFGHSLGGCTAATAMASDPRILAGADLDGTIFPTVPFDAPGGADAIKESIARIARGIGSRSFLIVASGVANGPTSTPAAIGPGFWENLSGWKRFIKIKGSTHHSFTDLPAFMDQLLEAGLIPEADLAHLSPFLGTIEPGRATQIERAYLAAFFQQALRGKPDRLLDGASHRYPEAEFLQ